MCLTAASNDLKIEDEWMRVGVEVIIRDEKVT